MKTKDAKLKRINFVSVIFFMIIAVFYLVYDKYSFSKQNAVEPFVSVISVSDGDTVTVMIDQKEEKVRLIGIDAPELGQQPWGQQSKQYLEDLLRASEWKVKLEYDVEKRDKYGRILAYLRTADGQLVNLSVLKNGYALLFTVPPNVRYVHELTTAQTQAREKRLGIWAEEGMKEQPVSYRKKHPRK